MRGSQYLPLARGKYHRARQKHYPSPVASLILILFSLDTYFVKESVAPMTCLLVAEVDGCCVDFVWVGEPVTVRVVPSEDVPAMREAC